jgi:hypothetical protein
VMNPAKHCEVAVQIKKNETKIKFFTVHLPLDEIVIIPDRAPGKDLIVRCYPWKSTIL